MKKGILPSLIVTFSLLLFVLLYPTLAQTETATSPGLGAGSTTHPPTMPNEEDRQRAASKMDEALLAQLRNSNDDQWITAIVRLGGQADLSGAAQLNGRAHKGAYVLAQLQSYANQKQANLRTALDGARAVGAVSEYHSYFIFNGLAVTANPAALWQIALRDDVQAVTANHEYQLSVNSNQLSVNSNQLSTTSLQSPIPNSPATAEWNIIQINADDVWTQYGITGTGVLVASIDSGVQYNHPALVNQYAGNTGSGFDHSFHWYDATTAGAAGTPYDDNGHGTHTMGTIAGGDGPGPFADDIGVAPGANWISVKAFSKQICGFPGGA
jgi:subtilisin family serine protease